MSLPPNASVGYGEAERNNRRTWSKGENIADTQETGSYFCEHPKPLETLANFHSKLSLDRASLAHSKKNVLVWKEVIFSIESNIVVEIKSETTSESWLSNVSITTRRKQGEAGNLWSNLDFGY